MNLGEHRVFQKPTQIAQITLISQMGTRRLTELHLRNLRNQRHLRPLLE